MANISSCPIRVQLPLSQLSPTEVFLRTELFASLLCCLCACTCTHLRGKGGNKTTMPSYSLCEGKCESHALMLCSTHCLPEANTHFPLSLRCSGTCDIDLTLTVLCVYVFTVPPSLDVLLLLSLWQYVDKAVTDTSCQEGHSGSCSSPVSYQW